MFSIKRSKTLLTVILLGSILSGCQVVNVKQQALNVTIANERNSILTQDKLSEASLNVLSMSGQEAKVCTDTPETCVNQLKNLPQILDEQFLSAASEMYLAKAMALSDTSDCKVSRFTKHKSEEEQKNILNRYDDCLDQQLSLLDKSIRYSYAYLFSTKRKPNDRIFDNRQVQIRDFYNQAIAKMVGVYDLRHPKKNVVEPQIHIGKSVYSIDFEFHKQLSGQKLEKLISSYNLNFSGLRTINRRDGFGSEFVAVFPSSGNEDINEYILDPLKYNYKNGVNPNIHNARYLAATYGLWVAENNLGVAAYLTLIDRDQHLTMPHLYMLEPYNPNKKIIVLVHGLASSPEAWIALTNDVMGDTVLRDNYQVWQVFYSTNMPILESRFQIYALLKQAFGSLNPSDPAVHDAVLVGHSMGGIISRLLVSDGDITKPALELMTIRQQNRFKKHPMVTERLQMHSINNFDRAIFLASPHRGTDYADRWFTLAARKIIRLPGAFLSAVATSLTTENLDVKDFLSNIDNGLIQNGPSDLSHQSKFMELTKNINPHQGLVFHSIMGNITKSDDPNVITDGIVPYKSAHLEGAKSEKVLSGGHSIQLTPQAVLELRRILREHLVEHGLYKP